MISGQIFHFFCLILHFEIELDMQRQRTGSQLSAFLKSGSLLSVLIIINVAVWVVSLLFPLVDYLYALPAGSASAGWFEWLALSSQWVDLLHRPWTLLTYMFLHNGFWHIFFWSSCTRDNIHSKGFSKLSHTTADISISENTESFS